MKNLKRGSTSFFKFIDDSENINGYFKIYQDTDGFIVILNGAHYLKLTATQASSLDSSEDFTTLENFNSTTYATAYP